MNYFAKPNLPNKRSERVIVDFRISDESVRTLKSLGTEIIKSFEVDTVMDEVCGHCDIQIHHLGGNGFICAPETYEYYKSVLPNADIIKGSKSLNEKYPDDVWYNAAAFGDFLICNTACTALEILSEYRSLNRKILNVKQGYAKCSICVVSDRAIITSDKGIYKTANQNEIDALLIESGFIELYGKMDGFIGGASGLIAQNILAVNGNIKTHKNCEDIIAFCKNYGVNVVSLNSGNIVDIGSIIPIF